MSERHCIHFYIYKYLGMHTCADIHVCANETSNNINNLSAFLHKANLHLISALIHDILFIPFLILFNIIHGANAVEVSSIFPNVY